MELNLATLESWLETAERHEELTGLKLAMDRDTIRELIERAKRLDAVVRKQRQLKPRS